MEDDLDALIDDENEMEETYIDEDEEDMAFLAEQDLDDDEENAGGATQNPPGTQDLDWLENEANGGATQNSNKRGPSDFEKNNTENDDDDDGDDA